MIDYPSLLLINDISKYTIISIESILRFLYCSSSFGNFLCLISVLVILTYSCWNVFIVISDEILTLAKISGLV